MEDIDFVEEEGQFSTKLDNFDHSNKTRFNLRYWQSTSFAQDDGAVFLYLCGEGTCSGIPSDRSYVMVMAKKFNATVFSLEHRYYGRSMPFKDLETSTLRWLNSEQALEDIANFIVWSTTKYQLSKSQKWIIIGGSYSGALSAWFRTKYPHLVVGSWASSAVIEAIDDFH